MVLSTTSVYNNVFVSTQYHSLYWATLLTLRGPGGSIERLSRSLSTARVDLNPHQVDAALFAMRSPLSKGVILADEVGLGKTIEAALVIAQRWAERRRRVLLILPATLRKQWQQELLDKFGLPSEILETPAFRQRGLINAFDQPGKVMICSYQLAASKAFELRNVNWDLIVIDEAHRLRNVYKKSSKIAATIREATLAAPKILLTATPLQNSLMELYGLISVIDPQVFGDDRSFREQFADAALNPTSQESLKERLKPICTRTLRKQVLEYVRFTERRCITRDFYPTDDEQKLYEQVSDYLQRPALVAIPNAQRQLITLVLRKLLASSTFAIATTPGRMADRLEEELKQKRPGLGLAENALPDDDYEAQAETKEEWIDDESDPDEEAKPKVLEFDRGAALEEIKDLRGFVELAQRVAANAKGQELINALEVAFEKAQALGAKRKAVIFTESRRTQNYLLDLLSEAGYRDEIVLMNATNTDPHSTEVYKRWLEKHKGTDAVSGSPGADRKAAIVEEFRERSTILIATESAAEGVNLQYCSLLVNYDLPWNPQRIEQRIGRCHRYGQQHDVVVVNFVNKRNAADQRVYALLKDKFKLFEGVFGTSDEVLGALESGVDLEKRIAAVYQTCRSTSEIDAAFTQLQLLLEESIELRMAETRRALFENFDEEVHDRLKVSKEQAAFALSERNQWLANLVKQELNGQVQFDDSQTHFSYEGAEAAPGFYNLDWREAESKSETFFRIEHPLAQEILKRAQGRDLGSGVVRFDYHGYGKRIAMLEPLIGESGWLLASKLTVKSFETEEFLLLSGTTCKGTVLSEDYCKKLLALPAVTSEAASGEARASLRLEQEKLTAVRLQESEARNGSYLDEELAKLDRWAEDLKMGLEHEIKEMDKSIREARRQATASVQLQDKLDAQKNVKAIESARNKKRRELFEAQDKIERQRDDLIANIEKQMKHQHEVMPLFAFAWSLFKLDGE